MDILLEKRATMTPKLDNALFLLEALLTDVAVRNLNIVAALAERVNSVKLRLDMKERTWLFHHRVTKFMKITVNLRIESGKNDNSMLSFLSTRTLRVACCLRGLGLGPSAVQSSAA